MHMSGSQSIRDIHTGLLSATGKLSHLGITKTLSKSSISCLNVFFVTRLQSNAVIKIVAQYLTDKKHEHILNDVEIKLTDFYSSQNYPKELCIVKVYDKLNNQEIILLTNNAN